MTSTVDDTSRKENGTGGECGSLTYSAGYAYARWVDEQGEEEKGPRREDYIPDTPFTSLMRACGYDPDAAVFWQGYCEYWSDRGVME